MSMFRWITVGTIVLTACYVVALAGQEQPATPISGAVEPVTFQDPAVPLIALPTSFASRREKKEVRLDNKGFAELANINGPGCIRHIWFLTVNNQDKLTLEITVDGAEEPQVRAPLNSFFGVMQDREPYFVDCAAFAVLPNPEAAKKDAQIPGTPGYNLFLPIPFSKSCQILVRGNEGAFLGTVVDWHRYEADTPLTSYRLHAEHKRFETTPPRGGTIEMAKVSGNGFLAGFVTGYIQKNKSDMVFTQAESRFFSTTRRTATQSKVTMWRTTTDSRGDSTAIKPVGLDAQATKTVVVTTRTAFSIASSARTRSRSVRQ